MVMRCITIASILLVLSGCANTQYVQIPCEEPPIINRPLLATDNLKNNDGPDVVIKAHRETIKTLQQWGLELEAALNAYRKKHE